MRRPSFSLLFLALFAGLSPGVSAQSPLLVYGNNLVNGFQNWSWATVDPAAVAVSHSADKAIGVTVSQPWQALYLHRADFNASRFQSLESESQTGIEILDLAGQKHLLQRKDIKALDASQLSIMPVGFENLPPKDLADLFEYMAASKVKP